MYNDELPDVNQFIHTCIDNESVAADQNFITIYII